MQNKFLALLVPVIITFLTDASSANICDRSHFTHDHLSLTHDSFVKKMVEKKTSLAKPASRSQKIQNVEKPESISHTDWQSIRSQIKQGKYKTYVNDQGGFKSANVANGFHISYGADGQISLTPYENEGDNYYIILKLYAVNYQNNSATESMVFFDQPDDIHVNENRLNYHWNNNITEYWINSEEKLEQWFEINQRPIGKTLNSGLLTIQMLLDTDLDVSLNDNALNIGSITYDRLKVWDINGNIMPAQLSYNNQKLSILIDDQQATYPLTIDPSFSQQAYLKASNTDSFDLFGDSVAISGDTIVVGAPNERSNATGVNGDQTDNSAAFSGAAYVFVRNGGTWSQQAYLKASNTDDFDQFGSSVAISGDTIVVGVFSEDSNATGVNGDQTDNSLSNSGAAYVFVRSGSTWSQQAYLKASNTDVDDFFGTSVAISGDTIVVGAWNEDSSATGVNGDQNDNLAPESGATYIFARNGSTWSQQAYLKASNTDIDDLFGISVAISGDTVVVGAPFERSNATGVNGDQTNNSVLFSGAAYVFVRSGSTWSQQAYLKASNTDSFDQFGISVAISGDTIVVGARNEDSGATGVNGDQTDNSALESGATYVFVRNGSNWSQQAYLKASNTDANDFFGFSVAISGNSIVITAFGEDSNATGVNGNQDDNSLSKSGAAYVFTRRGSTWSQQAYLKASNADEDDFFGSSVAVSEGTIVVGADQEASSTTVVNGDQTDNLASLSGAAYVFNINTTNTVGGTITGLSAGNSMTLQNNGGDDLVITGDGSFTFVTPLDDGTDYAVTVSEQPTGQTCSIVNGSGTLTGENVTDVMVKCVRVSLKLSTDALTFDTIFTGNEEVRSLFIINIGTVDLIISNFSNPDAPFYIDGGSCAALPVTLASSESCELMIRFNPSVEGNFKSSFAIISNADSSPDSVTLSGSTNIRVIPTLNQWSLLLMTLILALMTFRRQY